MAFDPRVKAEKNTGFVFRGQPITLSKTLGRPNKGLVAKGISKGMYPEKKKIEVVAIYAATGDAKRTSSLTKVPEATIKQWRKTDWFRDLLDEIREENNERIDVMFNEIIESSLIQVQDRVTNGDVVMHPKTGELVRKPVSVRDLSLVAAINIDKRQLLRGLPTSRTESVNNSSKLEQLADTFIKLANTKRNTEKVIEAEIIPYDNQESQGRLQSSVGEHGQEFGRSIDSSGSQEEVSAGGVLQTSEAGVQEETVDGTNK